MRWKVSTIVYSMLDSHEIPLGDSSAVPSQVRTDGVPTNQEAPSAVTPPKNGRLRHRINHSDLSELLTDIEEQCVTRLFDLLKARLDSGKSVMKKKAGLSSATGRFLARLRQKEFSMIPDHRSLRLQQETVSRFWPLLEQINSSASRLPIVANEEVIVPLTDAGNHSCDADQEDEDPSAVGTESSGPTDAKPGSEEKVLMLAARYAAGIPLFLPDDVTDHGPRNRREEVQARIATDAALKKEADDAKQRAAANRAKKKKATNPVSEDSDSPHNNENAEIKIGSESEVVVLGDTMTSSLGE